MTLLNIRTASKTMEKFLQNGEKAAALSNDWFAKYLKTLDLLNIRFSSVTDETITRKDFLRIVMEVLVSAGL